MCYAYTTPGIIYHEGWTKIGYTEQDVDTELNNKRKQLILDIIRNGLKKHVFQMDQGIHLQIKSFIHI